MADAVRRWSVPVAILVVLVVCLGLFQVQRDQRSRVFDGTDGAALDDQVVITVTVRGVDPATDQMQLRVDVDPGSQLVDDDGKLLDPLLVEAPALSVRTIEFAEGVVPKGTDATLDTTAGIDTDFPLDEYTSAVGFRALSGDGDDAEEIDVALVGFASSPGYLVDMSSLDVDGGLGLSLEAQRSLTTRLVAVLIMAILWALALSVANVARLIASGSRPFEFASLTWMGAMIFAMFALRNAAPGNAPFGSLLDLGALLPAEIIVTVSLVACAWRYVHPEPADATKPG